MITLPIALKRRSPKPTSLPPSLLAGPSAFPAEGKKLRVSVPLEPLLAADAPDRLALTEPTDTAQNIRSGQPVVLRFNRPMVDGAKVGKEAPERVIVWTPEIRGQGSWTSRNAYAFRPAAATWEKTTIATFTLDGDLRSLAGEELSEMEPKTVVFDAGPRLASDSGSSRLMPGEPLHLRFVGNVDTAALPSQIMAYEVDGGKRMLPFSISVKPRDTSGRTPVDVLFSKTLEPGAHIALALAPPLVGGGSRPRVVDAELKPRPKIEGIGCPLDARDKDACSFDGAPGRVVEVGEELVLMATDPLAPINASSVDITPSLEGLSVRVDGKRIVVRGDFAPGQTYRVKLDGLRTTDGHDLARAPVLAVRSSGRAPEVHARTGFLTFERDAKPALTIAAIHVEDGDARLAPIATGDELAAALDPARFISKEREGKWIATPLHPIVPTSKPNRWGRGVFPWNDVDPTHGSMSVFSFVPDRGTEAKATVTFAQRTDLGLDVKVLATGVLVWVTSIAGAQPIAGAHVTVASAAREEDRPLLKPIEDALTDAGGVAWIPFLAGDTEKGVVVRAELGGDRAVMVVDPSRSIGARHLGVDAGSHPQIAGAPVAGLLLDRGICRPGEAIHAKAVVRMGAEGSTIRPFEGDVKVMLFSPSTTVPLAVVEGPLSPFGTIDASFAIDERATPGRYVVEVRRPDEVVPIRTASFTVGDFEPPAYRVDLTTPKASLFDGDALRVDVAARYFFGPPAAGSKATWSIVRADGARSPSRWKGFVFGALNASLAGGTLASGQLSLDASGHASVEERVRLNVPLRGSVTFEIGVRDLSGSVTSARKRVDVYPAEVEVGMKELPAWIEAGSALALDAIAIGNDDGPREGKKIAATITREAFHTYWEWSGRKRHSGDDDGGEDEGAYQKRRTRSSEVVHTCALVSSKEPVRCSFKPEKHGTYVLSVTMTDDRGRRTTAAQRVYVAGPGEHPDRDPPGASIALTPSLGGYDVGAIAEVAFESPFPDAEALFTVEREGVLHREVKRVGPGGHVMRFPVTEAMIPNVFASLALVRPRTGPPVHSGGSGSASGPSAPTPPMPGERDLGAPDLRVAVAEIRVLPKVAPLRVTIEVPDERAPADSEVPVRVVVEDEEGHGVPAEVALYAVDEPTLRVTAYSVPDLASGFFPRRSPSFFWEDLRRSIAPRDPSELAPSAGGDGDSHSVRSVVHLRDNRERFEPTPLWEPHLVTDASGRAEVMMRLPKRPAQYRIMAAAVDEGARAGTAERAITASMPLVIRPSLPVFAVAGDRFEAVAFIHNTEDDEATVTVTPFVDDAPAEPITLHLAPRSEGRAGVWIEPSAPGDHALRFEAISDRAAIAEERDLRVLPRGRFERSRLTFAIAESRDLAVSFPEDGGVIDGPVSIFVSGHPFTGVSAGADVFLDLSDAALEPSVSSVLGLTAYGALGANRITCGDGDRPEIAIGPRLCGEELRARVAAAIAKVASFQTPSGGFGAYSSHSAADASLTAYALVALRTAKRGGAVVPQAVIDRAKSYLADQARGSSPVDGRARDELAAWLRALSASGSPDRDREQALFDQRVMLSPFGLASLALAMDPADTRRDTLVAEALLRALATREDEIKNPRLLRYYEQSSRTFGAVLEAACTTAGFEGEAGRVAASLLSGYVARSGSWGSARETAHALAALSVYASTLREESSIDARVALDGAPFAPIVKGSEVMTWSPSAALLAHGQHALHFEAKGTAWATIEARRFIALGPNDREARGDDVALHRVLEDATGKPLGADARVKLGDLVRVRLFIYNETSAPSAVTLRDRLAAGLVPIDAAHETTPRASLAALLGMGPDDDVMDARGHHASRSLDAIAHRAFLADKAVFHLTGMSEGLTEITYGVRAATPGTFTLLPAELEAPDVPSYVARSAVATITVEAE